MKAAEIKIGGLYKTKISGRIVTVKVNDITEMNMGRKTKTIYYVINLDTGRTTRFRSASKFRWEVTEDSEVVKT